MEPKNRFKINQYNWFGQKLLAQHRYHELLELRQHLSGAHKPFSESGDEDARQIECLLWEDVTIVSDHVNYLSGLAMIKIGGSPSTGLIETLQRLDYRKNGQYFLLLCQYLLYLGNHDSVVAICRQVLNNEIVITDTSNGMSDPLIDLDTDTTIETSSQDRNFTERGEEKANIGTRSISNESIEFRNLITSVHKNRLVNDPRLWSIFAYSLELQGQIRDADFAYRVASKLACGLARQVGVGSEMHNESLGRTFEAEYVAMTEYNEPHARYIEFCIRYRDDYKTAIQVLNQANSTQSSHANYTLKPALALLLCSQPTTSATFFTKATHIIEALDNHAASTRNPSSIYNQISLRCKRKLQSSSRDLDELAYEYMGLECSEEQKRLSLDYALTKSFLIINHIVQNNADWVFQIPGESSSCEKSTQDTTQRQLDVAISALRSCEPSCWLSAALWNNLGVCYLMKRRYVASLSSFRKALELNPLDWRINCNISSVYLHVNLSVGALCHSLAAKNYHRLAIRILTKSNLSVANPLISDLLASSYTKLRLNEEARRYYAEMMVMARKDALFRAPIYAIVNYLLTLHKIGHGIDSEWTDGNRLIVGVLNHLEQGWLQRSPNENQFVPSLLDIAREIGESHQNCRPQSKKSYAWTKT